MNEKHGVLQSISKVNNLCLASKYSHVWVQAEDLQTIQVYTHESVERNQPKGPDQTSGRTGALL